MTIQSPLPINSMELQSLILDTGICASVEVGISSLLSITSPGCALVFSCSKALIGYPSRVFLQKFSNQEGLHLAAKVILFSLNFFLSVLIGWLGASLLGFSITFEAALLITTSSHLIMRLFIGAMMGLAIGLETLWSL